MNGQRLLILNGSPRRQGTSYSFARTIKKLAEDAGNQAEIRHVIDYFDGQKSLNDLKYHIAESDIIALVAPLYADTLPYPDIWCLEKLAAEYSSELSGKMFFAVGQCGFPDITRLEPMIDACRFFAEETGMIWRGGLAYGGGAIINGALLENLGKKGKKITSAFKLALGDVIQGKMISARAQDLLTVRIPRILYRPLAAYLNHKIKKDALKHGITDVSRKVYLE
ncbi:MAG: hypothetical protein QHH10_05080 [Peptococcaceae bacterium]|jgi:multimeric flavodoxin WrbA|nr:hypothetical protein [Peptococcaceae bacterium]MDH7524671.1 hypothetical protein [Peptococcaceae bacterium]